MVLVHVNLLARGNWKTNLISFSAAPPIGLEAGASSSSPGAPPPQSTHAIRARSGSPSRSPSGASTVL